MLTQSISGPHVVFSDQTQNRKPAAPSVIFSGRHFFSALDLAFLQPPPRTNAANATFLGTIPRSVVGFAHLSVLRPSSAKFWLGHFWRFSAPPSIVWTDLTASLKPLRHWRPHGVAAAAFLPLSTSWSPNACVPRSARWHFFACHVEQHNLSAFEFYRGNFLRVPIRSPLAGTAWR